MSADLFDRSAVPAPHVSDLQSVGAKQPVSGDRSRWKVCLVCGRPGAFGFGASVRHQRIGRWACFDHRDQVERMAS